MYKKLMCYLLVFALVFTSFGTAFAQTKEPLEEPTLSKEMDKEKVEEEVAPEVLDGPKEPVEEIEKKTDEVTTDSTRAYGPIGLLGITYPKRFFDDGESVSVKIVLEGEHDISTLYLVYNEYLDANSINFSSTDVISTKAGGTTEINLELTVPEGTASTYYMFSELSLETMSGGKATISALDNEETLKYNFGVVRDKPVTDMYLSTDQSYEANTYMMNYHKKGERVQGFYVTHMFNYFIDRDGRLCYTEILPKVITSEDVFMSAGRSSIQMNF